MKQNHQNPRHKLKYNKTYVEKSGILMTACQIRSNEIRTTHHSLAHTEAKRQQQKQPRIDEQWIKKNPEDDTSVIAYILTIYTNVPGIFHMGLEWCDGVGAARWCGVWLLFCHLATIKKKTQEKNMKMKEKDEKSTITKSNWCAHEYKHNGVLWRGGLSLCGRYRNVRIPN